MEKNANCQVLPWIANNLVLNKRAFTLIELLVVIAIMTVVTSVVVMTSGGLTNSRAIPAALDDIGGVLEQAKAYAMANNTYVFVGFTEVDALNVTQPGIGRILLVTMGSMDGTKDFGTNQSNLTMLFKPLVLKGVHFADSLPNSGSMSRPVVPDPYRLGNMAFIAQNSFTSYVYQNQFTFTKIIQFDPRGVASVQSDTISIQPWIEIGVIPAIGDTVGGTQNCGALILDGMTGSVTTYRP